MALSSGASELLELFLWKGNEDADPYELNKELVVIKSNQDQLNRDLNE